MNIFLPTSIALTISLLVGCGGGTGGSNTPDNGGGGQQGNHKKYTLKEYYFPSNVEIPFRSDKKVIYYKARILNPDGSAVWVTPKGKRTIKPTSTDDYNGNIRKNFKSNFFTFVNTGSELGGRLNTFIELGTRSAPWYSYGDIQSYYYTKEVTDSDYTDTPGQKFLDQWGEKFVSYSHDETTVLDKYAFYRKPQTVDSGDSYKQKSDFNGTQLERVCNFNFMPTLALKTVFFRATGVFKDVLKESCTVSKVSNAKFIESTVYYYAKDIGEIHRIAKRSDGIAHITVDKRYTKRHTENFIKFDYK